MVMEDESIKTKSKRKRTVEKKKKEMSKTKRKEEFEDMEEQESLFQVQLGGDFSRLPTDIFLDILSRVPLLSLCNCKWVCKTWYKLIHHPSFAKMHYTHSLQNNTSSCVFLYDRCKEFYVIDDEVFDNFKTWASVYNVKFNEFKELFPAGLFEIVGSVNGLLCFSPHPVYFHSSPYYLCNPITREYLILPNSPKYKKAPTVSGFGFDSTSNEYKIIRILQTVKSLKSQAEVHTIGSGRWRPIPTVPYITYRTPANVLVNGSLHWLTRENDDSLVIVTFIVGLEEFHGIPPPNINLEQKDTSYYLGVLGGCLCFIEADLNVFSDDNKIWVMKEHGVQGSWAKEYHIRREVMVNFWDGSCKVTMLRTGEFLLQYGRQKVGYYDPKSETFRPIVIQNNRRLREGYVKAVIQVGSLLSPKNLSRLTNR